MAKSDLLKQAIADAKTVKETALANAKIALQEAFAPRLTRMFAEKLDAGLMDEEEDETAAMEAGAEAGAEAGMAAGKEMGDDFNWTDDTLAASVGGKDYNFQVGMAGGKEMEEPAGAIEEPASEEEMAAEYNEGMDMMDSDLDISEIIRELEEDAGMDAPDEMMPSDMEEGMYFEDEFSDEKGMKDPMMMASGDEDVSDIDEIIEAILREEGEMGAEEPASTEDSEVIEAMEAEIADKEEKLEEAYRTVKHLQNVINEVNLLNAKLLYTNKLFRNFELSESQKMKVIENFDRAANTREAKLVFATLAESFKRPTKKRVVKESYASKATTTTAPSKQTTQILSEGFEMANRWKKLAGLL
jgi:hypothetical protein